MELYLFMIFGCGAIGALTADILKDNTLELPKNINGKIVLGSLGGVIIGGIAGLTIDGSPLTAFMGGYMGKKIITELISKKPLGL